MDTSRNSKNITIMTFAITLLTSLVAGTGPARAAGVLNSCTTYCHGMPPRDAARKGNLHFNSQSSAFIGNHRNHLSATPSASDCSMCHTPVASSNFGHQNNIIEMAVKLKGYSSISGRAKYDKGIFFNQTSIPVLTGATCSNASCHFEKKTPAWGSVAFSAPGDCNACHGVPPAGGATGAAGSHARHDAYFPGTPNCQKCHPGYVAFSHASSAGRALRVQGYLRDPLNIPEASGTYSGTGTNYLPGQSGSQVFGSCATIYCHSSAQGPAGTGTVTYQTVTWGSGALTCGSCHADMSTSSSAPGSHVQHAQTAAIGCAVCHGASYSATSVPTGSGTTHVDKSINLGFTGAAVGTTYGKTSTFSPGSAYGSCSTSICHGQGTVTWGAIFSTGATFPYSASLCDKCHSGTAAAPFYSTGIPKVTSSTDAKVGAHTAHLTSTDSLATASVCADCHGTVVLNTATHMNGTTTFSWSSLATKNGTLTPTYTPASGVCANVYCHGASMPGGDSSGSNKAPIWKDPNYLPTTFSAAACGTCHGFPPSTVSGHPAVTLPVGFPVSASIGTTCSCHSNINAAGNSYATMFVDMSLHINGTVDVAVGGSCDTCHGYPPASVGFAGTQNNWSSSRTENYVGGGGAHTIQNHVSKTARPGEGFINCTKCHNAADHVMSPIVFNPSQNIKVTVNQRYRLEAAKQFKYSSNRLNTNSHVTGTCSNSSCHFGATPKWDPAH